MAAHPAGAMTPSEIEELPRFGRRAHVFDLADALVEGDGRTALRSPSSCSGAASTARS